MAKFNYIAMDAAGKEVKGSVEASDRAQAIAQIRAQNLFPTAIGQVGAGIVNAPMDCFTKALAAFAEHEGV